MSIAQSVKKQIESYYDNGYINYVDLAVHLQDSRIDNFEPTKAHVGYEKPYKEAIPVVFYYEDNSMLIVKSTGIESAQKD